MGADTKIEWCDHTFNPWIGCAEVSPGCDNCYARTMANRRGWAQWGPHEARKRTSAGNWSKVLAWDRAAAKAGTTPAVFIASLADVFDNAVPADWRADLWALLRQTTNLRYLLTTKRVGNAASMLPDWWDERPFKSALIISVVNQQEADRDLPKALALRDRFDWLLASYEPALGPVDWRPWLPWVFREGLAPNPDGKPFSLPAVGGSRGLDGIIAGGESGPGARPAHPDWFRSTRDQCAAAGVAFNFKQWGEWVPQEQAHPDALSPRTAASALYVAPDGSTRDAKFGARGSSVTVQRVGKRLAGRLLDGREHNDLPYGVGAA